MLLCFVLLISVTMAELVDALDLGSSGDFTVRVQVPLVAPKNTTEPETWLIGVSK